MSYVQAYSGKIAGYGRLQLFGLGLGDAAYDQAVAAYNADHALWLQQKAAYDKAVAAYAGQNSGAASSYASGMAAYNADLASWNAESAARTAAVVARSQQQIRNQRALDSANAAARAAGVVTPAGYPGCVSQAQHNAWQADCNTVNTTVKGLGAAAIPSGPSCALALLPVCLAPLPAIAPLRPKPTPPTMPSVGAPPSPLRPEPQPPAPPASQPPPSQTTPTPSTPPVLNTGPQSIPSIVPTPTPPVTASPPSTKSGGLISNGLLVVVLAGGAYALYRTFKKPKARA